MKNLELEDFKPPVKLKLAALWTSLMFLYVYGDYFGLYVKGVILKMNDGIMGPLGEATPNLLMAIALMMAIPGLMIFATLILPPKISKVLNIIISILFTLIVGASLMGGAELFYTIYSIIEMIITISICYFAFKWPKQNMVNTQ